LYENSLAMRLLGKVAVAFMLLVALISVFLLWSNEELIDVATDVPSNDVVEFLSSKPDASFKSVIRGSPISLPKDFGAHSNYRQEWWYFTGILTSKNGRRFGYQLTFFRFGGQEEANYKDSKWSSSNIWMAHFALSDIQSGKLFAAEDYARGAINLAGVNAHPFRVWLNGWSVEEVDIDDSGNKRNWHVQANSKSVSLDLKLIVDGAPVLHGDEGYSEKNWDGDSASYYFSFPHIESRGELIVDDESFVVTGSSWMDREWSTSVLNRNQLGWDWMGLRFPDKSSLMVFQVRNRTNAPYRYAIYIQPGGQVQKFESDGIILSPKETWSLPNGNSNIPINWELSIPALDMSLTVLAAFNNQYLNLDFSYWEGVVDVQGSFAGASIKGEGYLEMTGY